MSSALDIINMALSDCGTNVLSSISDVSAEGTQARAKYNLIRDAVLEDREWTFAKARILLVKDAQAPVFGYSFQFIIPSDVIRVVRVYDSKGADSSGFPGAQDDSLGAANNFPQQVSDWVREGYRILSNEDAPLYAEVLRRVDEGTFSPGMVLALAARLTSVFAIPLTENRQLAADFDLKYDKLIKSAGAMDGSQGRTQMLRPPALPGRRQNL